MIRKRNNQIFIAVDCKKRQQWAYLYIIYYKGSNKSYIFDVARSGCIACVHATTISQPSRDAMTQQSNNIHAVSCKDDSNKQCWSRRWQQWAYLSYHMKQQWWWLIAAKEREIAPHNNLPNTYVTLRKQATIAKWQHCWRNDHVLHCVARGYDNGDNGWLQKSMQDRANNKQPFLLM